MGKIKNILAAVTDLPSSSFGERPYIELEGNSFFKLDGCREILNYDDTAAVFQTKESVITVSGEKLEISSYGNSTVRLKGIICDISIRENGKC